MDISVINVHDCGNDMSFCHFIPHCFAVNHVFKVAFIQKHLFKSGHLFKNAFDPLKDMFVRKPFMGLRIGFDADSIQPGNFVFIFNGCG